MKFVTSVWLVIWTLTGCSAQAPEHDDGEIQEAESESLCVKNALTPAQEQAALKAIDDICGDTWCEGDDNFAFRELRCSAPRGDRDGACKLELRIIPLEGAPGYPHTFERHCTTGDFSGFSAHSVLRWLLILGAIAPFILAWIIARGHALTWRPGEVTMIVGIVAFMLILCNGIILGKPDPGIEVGLGIGYFVGLLASLGLLGAGYLRQALYTTARKPPGVI